jgi:hypothetical protein
MAAKTKISASEVGIASKAKGDTLICGLKRIRHNICF